MKMKEWITRIGYFLLAPFLLLLEGMLWLFIGIPLWVLEKWRYTAQCLRYPPPPGGMYGNLARAYKNRPDRPDTPDREI